MVFINLTIIFSFSLCTENKKVMKVKREEAQEEIRQRLEDQTKKNAETKREHEKLAISEMMKVSFLIKNIYKFIFKTLEQDF